MDRDIDSVRRGIAVMESFGLDAIKKDGKPIPGLTLADWRAKLAVLELQKRTKNGTVVDLFNFGEDT